MKYSILGFNQERVISLGLNMNDLLLMQYIQYATASPSMDHLIDENKNSYVWLHHKKILEDLPILDISEDRLKRYLKKLVDLELIKRVTTAKESLKGTKSYYAITQKFELLQFSSVENNTCKNNHVLKTTPENEFSSVENNTSYNKLENIDNKLNKSNSKELLQNFEFGKPKEKKQNLYQKCVNMIDDYTTDINLRKALIQYLDLRLEIKDKPLYVNSWKGLLNKLSKIADENPQCKIDIVNQSIERGYASFFPVNNYSYSGKKSIKDEEYEKGVTCESYTEEELKEQEKWREEMRKQGKRVTF